MRKIIRTIIIAVCIVILTMNVIYSFKEIERPKTLRFLVAIVLLAIIGLSIERNFAERKKKASNSNT